MAATWDEVEEVTFTRRRDIEHDRDVFTVDKAPRVIALSAELLGHPLYWIATESEPAWMPWPFSFTFDRVRRRTLFHWRFDNCWCTYRIVDESVARQQYLLERIPALGED